MTQKSTNTKANRPTHILFHVTGDGENARWNRIGAAWTHRDGNGFNLDLEMIPAKPGRYVVRTARQKEAAQG
ncbi:MAG: hypothetical protein JJ897_12370 [Marinibacterium sp.]|nr:hypothetical protein [Marinibacterium sp.]